MRQQGAHFLPALSPGGASVSTRKQQSEIVPQREINGILQRQRHASGLEFCRHAASKRVRSRSRRNALTRSARNGSRIRLRLTNDCSTNQGFRAEKTQRGS